ncbi:unnamed protein product [Heligmosomoides polygyrus]|uniref:Ras-GEF domain-containing protein n=1 Tax=Heligmosomoides polygyrus TaxID=6339 RepID=A0A183FX68_HELPZ|nr:unnamed protein product [Heligmosomoides polygyrus]
MLMYVWAYEQPNGTFPSQDLLVPWNLSEIPINVIIWAMLAQSTQTVPYRLLGADEEEIQTIRPLLSTLRSNSPPPAPPPAAPKFLPTARNALITGVKRWSPMLGRRLATLLVSVEEQVAEEITQKILHEALTETMATLREVTFYRFYHVFRKGELESLVTSIPSLCIVRSSFEHGNWCVVVEKCSIQPEPHLNLKF